MDSSSCLKIVSAGGFGAGGLPHTSALVMSAVPIGPEQDPSKLLPSDILRHRFTPSMGKEAARGRTLGSAAHAPS